MASRVDPEALLRRLDEAGFRDEAEALRTTRSFAEGSEFDPGAGDEAIPDRLGPFEIVGELGRGGYGVVLLGAQRSPVRRLAAVKLLKRGMDSAGVLARFRAEQQALVLMDHRAVATVFESGVADDGRPWFAMPLVAGVPITAHADLERLDLQARLRLFREAALGVLHAHERGVLHRDLKPSNILVGIERGVPQPRVIDFGIAKAIDATDPLVSHMTMADIALGTPAYMAPEQAAGRAEVRSDVWALGVILGELLAGARPLDRDPVRAPDGRVETARSMAPSERLRRWWRVDPVAAHESAELRGLDVGALTTALRGDLDAIVIHCLEDEPSRRYVGVAQLVEDIDRHLDGRPVLARPPSAAYRTVRFVRRNRVAVGVAVLVAVALLVATVVSVNAAIRAGTEARAARAVTDFLVQTLGAADPWRAGGQQDLLVREALDAAAARLERGEFAGRPAESARIELAIGATRLQLGLAREALPSLRRASEALAGQGDLRDLGDALHWRGRCEQALGELAAAEASLREASSCVARADGPESSDALKVRNDLALCLQERGDAEGAERIYREVLEIARRPSRGDDEIAGITKANLGMLLQATGRLDEADVLIRESLDAHRARVGSDALELAMDWNNLALLKKDLGSLPEAESAFRESLRILQKGLDAGHPNVALVEINLADLLQRMDRGPEAIALLAKADGSLRKAYGADHSEVARTQNMLGFALRDADKPQESEAAFREAVRIWRIAPGGDHPDLATGLNNLARSLQDSGRPAEALPIADEAVAMIERMSGLDDPRRWVFLARRGSILSDLDRWSEADAQLRAALEGLERTQAPASRVRTVIEALAKCHERRAAAEPSAEHEAAARAWRARLSGP